MLSASSSSCECGDHWKCNNAANHHDRNNQCYWKNNFYPSFRQPVVYFAQIPLTRTQKGGINKKRNPNCFVRAFRWYTEEHIEDPKTQSSKFNPDIVGFATWLDTKYEEFTQKNQIEHTEDNISFKSTSVIETENIQHLEVRSKHIVKKFARLRSPWRRRKSNKDASDLKYILHPKDLARPPSECLHVSQTSYNHSEPVVSIEVEESRKLIIKSHSCTSVCDKSNRLHNLSQLNQEGNVEELSLLNQKDILYENVMKSNVSSKSLVTDLTKDVSCQCSETIIEKIDKHTQYDNHRERISDIFANEGNVSLRPNVVPQPFCLKKCCDIETQTESLLQVPVKTSTKRIVQEFDYRNNISCQCYDEILKIDARNEIDHNISTSNKNSANDSLILKHFAALTKTTNSFTILVNDTVQTSDCSIVLEKDDGHNYPLFMRVIYADKLDKNIRN